MRQLPYKNGLTLLNESLYGASTRSPGVSCVGDSRFVDTDSDVSGSETIAKLLIFFEAIRKLIGSTESTDLDSPLTFQEVDNKLHNYKSFRTNEYVDYISCSSLTKSEIKLRTTLLQKELKKYEYTDFSISSWFGSTESFTYVDSYQTVPLEQFGEGLPSPWYFEPWFDELTEFFNEFESKFFNLLFFRRLSEAKGYSNSRPTRRRAYAFFLCSSRVTLLLAPRPGPDSTDQQIATVPNSSMESGIWSQGNEEQRTTIGRLQVAV